MRRKTRLDSDIESIYTYIGKRIAFRRRKAGLTQEQLAKLIGINRVNLCLHERGLSRISIHHLELIGATLGCTTGSFLARRNRGKRQPVEHPLQEFLREML